MPCALEDFYTGSKWVRPKIGTPNSRVRSLPLAFLSNKPEKCTNAEQNSPLLTCFLRWGKPAPFKHPSSRNCVKKVGKHHNCISCLNKYRCQMCLLKRIGRIAVRLWVALQEINQLPSCPLQIPKKRCKLLRLPKGVLPSPKKVV